MADEVWILPNNAHGLEPFGESITPDIVIDNNDIGVPNIRNRSTHQRVFHIFDMIFTDAEWETLKYWVKTNLKNGIEPFRFPRANNYTADQTQWELYRFALDITGGVWYSNYKHNYNLHQVTFTLELL